MKIVVRTDKAEFSKRAGAFQAKVARAVAQGLNEGGDKVRTQVRAAMREQTSLLRLKSVTSRSSTIRAFVGSGKGGVSGLSYAMVFRGKPSTKPSEFAFGVKKGPGGGVTIRMWGVDHKFKRSFQIAGATGAAGLRMRLGPEQYKIRSFDGPNLAKEAAKGLVAETFVRSAATLPLEAINRRLAAL